MFNIRRSGNLVYIESLVYEGGSLENYELILYFREDGSFEKITNVRVPSVLFKEARRMARQ